MPKAYTITEIKRTIAELQNVFDIVRIVDPIFTAEAALDRPLGTGPTCDGCSCYSVWGGRGERCRNCVSLRALRENERQSKFEFIGNEVYHVVSLPVELEGHLLALEIVDKVNDQVLLNAYGRDEFVRRITGYNEQTEEDELTGLFNRRCFEEKLYLMLGEVAARGQDACVALLDVDGMDEINRGFGRPVGDELLISVGRLLTAHISPRRGDFAARYGGDSFMVVMRGVPEALWTERVRELLSRIAGMRMQGYETLRVSACAGGVRAGENRGLSVEGVIDRLHKRLEAAKRLGRGEFVHAEERKEAVNP